jgi:hypothetical protein
VEDLAKEPEDAPATIELPAELDRWKQSDTASVAGVQAKVREEFIGWFARGYAAVGVRKTPAGAAYLLVPWNDF